MKVEVFEKINAPISEVWKIVTDIDNAEKNISAITHIEVLERPQKGMVGLKWKETRTMFGKEAKETMWVTEAEENNYYKTQAFNSGCEYTTVIKVADVNNGTKLSMTFGAVPKSFLARLFTPLSYVFKGMIKKALQQDLVDIKKIAEQQVN